MELIDNNMYHVIVVEEPNKQKLADVAEFCGIVTEHVNYLYVTHSIAVISLRKAMQHAALLNAQIAPNNNN